MPGADHLLGGEAFEDQIFDGIDAAGADLGGKELYRCTFRNAKLAQTRWARTRLEDCVFEGCDLSQAMPGMLSLRAVKYEHCKLMGIDWTGVGKNPDVTFLDSNLRYASFIGLALRKTLFKGCAVVEASFLDVDLAEARFEGCLLTGTQFQSCELRAARFTDCRGLFLDPTRNRIKKTAVPLETAVLLAMHFGLEVSGWSTGDSDDD